MGFVFFIQSFGFFFLATLYWSGGGYAHANTKNGSAKVGRKGDPLLVSMVVAVAVAVADLV